MRRILFFAFLVMLAYFIFSKLWGLLISGKIFDEGALKEAFRESGQTVWWFMKTFVVVWLLYLVFVYFARNH